MHARSASLFAFCLAIASFAPVHAQGPDELWEVKTVMIMEGMRMPGPPTKVCVKGTQADRMTPMDKDCKTSDVKTVGNRTTYRVVCTGKEPMTGTGEITRDKSSYRGILKLTSTVGGESTTMVNEYTGRLVGKCTAK
jgi:hypothetical protein